MRSRAATGTSTALPGWLIVRMVPAVGAAKQVADHDGAVLALAPGELGDRRVRDRADALRGEHQRRSGRTGPACVLGSQHRADVVVGHDRRIGVVEAGRVHEQVERVQAGVAQARHEGDAGARGQHATQLAGADG